MSDFLDGFKPNENLGGESLWELVKDAETPTEGKSENETPKPTIKPPSEPIPTFDVEKSAEMVKSLNEVYKEMLDIYIDTTKTNEERYDAIKEIEGILKAKGLTDEEIMRGVEEQRKIAEEDTRAKYIANLEKSSLREQKTNEALLWLVDEMKNPNSKPPSKDEFVKRLEGVMTKEAAEDLFDKTFVKVLKEKFPNMTGYDLLNITNKYGIDPKSLSPENGAEVANEARESIKFSKVSHSEENGEITWDVEVDLKNTFYLNSSEGVRNFVVVKMNGKSEVGKKIEITQAFYQSTGKNSGYHGKWFPCNGTFPKGLNEWIVKEADESAPKYIEVDGKQVKNPARRLGSKEFVSHNGEILTEISDELSKYSITATENVKYENINKKLREISPDVRLKFEPHVDFSEILEN